MTARIEQLAPLADHLIAVEPDADLVTDLEHHRRAPRRSARGPGDRPDPDLLGPRRGHGGGAGPRAVPLVRRRMVGQRRPPDHGGFAGATQFVRPEDVADNIPCGPDLDAIVEGVRPYWEAGFTDVALVQVGGEHQEQFLAEAAAPLLEKLPRGVRLTPPLPHGDTARVWPRAEPIRTRAPDARAVSVAHASEMVAVLADQALYERTGGEAPTEEELTAATSCSRRAIRRTAPRAGSTGSSARRGPAGPPVRAGHADR